MEVIMAYASNFMYGLRNLSHSSWYIDDDSNPEPSEYKAEVLTTLHLAQKVDNHILLVIFTFFEFWNWNTWYIWATSMMS